MTAIAGTTAIGIIPARYASKRFPGKALAAIAGRPMIQHVWESARAAKRLREVLIATDDERIGLDNESNDRRAHNTNERFLEPTAVECARCRHVVWLQF